MARLEQAAPAGSEPRRSAATPPAGMSRAATPLAETRPVETRPVAAQVSVGVPTAGTRSETSLAQTPSVAWVQALATAATHRPSRRAAITAVEMPPAEPARVVTRLPATGPAALEPAGTQQAAMFSVAQPLAALLAPAV